MGPLIPHSHSSLWPSPGSWQECSCPRQLILSLSSPECQYCFLRPVWLMLFFTKNFRFNRNSISFSSELQHNEHCKIMHNSLHKCTCDVCKIFLRLNGQNRNRTKYNFSSDFSNFDWEIVSKMHLASRERVGHYMEMVNEASASPTENV